MTTSLEHERNRALLDWYRSHRRDLPWRATADPYPILVSEVMLQQTQAERVVPYFTRFLDRFPTLEALAAASFSDVAALWSGLGYNTRAKRLQETARLVAASGWPRHVAGLEALPGVGPYTARALAAFAFGMKVAAVDTNLRRVLSRWHGEVLDGAALGIAADTAIDDSDPAAWNQAMMDLGATLCRPRAPGCTACPVADWCAGPGVYEPPRPQPRFEGSLRQVRGAIMRRLIAGPADIDDLTEGLGFPTPAVDDALDGLIEDGLVVETDDGFELTE